MKRNLLLCMAMFMLTINGTGQESNIIKYTPSKLLEKNQWDFKIFNNLYTENKGVDDKGETFDFARRYFYTTTFELAWGATESRRVNLGLIGTYKSNVINNEQSEPNGISDVFAFQDKDMVSRSGFTAIAPVIKYTPSPNIGNLSIQTAFFIPLIDYETKDGIFLDKKSYTIENRIFFDKTYRSKYQLFLELDINYHFGEKLDFDYDEELMISHSIGGYANNALATPASIFFSYFPNSKITLYAMTQHYQLFDLGNDFAQNFTQSGVGTKLQVTRDLNLELLYTNFWRGNSTGLGETFNLGLRYLLN